MGETKLLLLLLPPPPPWGGEVCLIFCIMPVKKK